MNPGAGQECFFYICFKVRMIVQYYKIFLCHINKSA